MGELSNLASYRNITYPKTIRVYNVINEALHDTTHMLLPTIEVLPTSWFIGLYCILCHILILNLTNKMFMHVIKNYIIENYV